MSNNAKGASQAAKKQANNQPSQSTQPKTAPAAAPQLNASPEDIKAFWQMMSAMQDLRSQINVYSRTEAMEGLLDLHWGISNNPDLDGEVSQTMAGFINYIKESLICCYELIEQIQASKPSDKLISDIIRTFSVPSPQ